MPYLPQVVAYNAVFHVRRGRQVLTFELSVADWAPDDEVLREFGGKVKARTVGDIVRIMEREGAVRVEANDVDSFYCRGDREILEMDRPI